MIVLDFISIMTFLTSMLAGMFSMLDGVVVVSDGSTSLTLLGLFVSIAFFTRTLDLINDLRSL